MWKYNYGIDENLIIELIIIRLIKNINAKQLNQINIKIIIRICIKIIRWYKY